MKKSWRRSNNSCRRSGRRSGWRVLWLLCCPLLVGCAAGRGRVTKDLRVLENQADLKRAARELDGRLLGIRTLKATGQLAGHWMGREGVYQIVCAVRWPNALRIDLLDPALGPVAALVVAEGVFQWHLPQENRVYQGEATPRAMGRVTAVAWSPAELTGLLVGLPPMEYGDRFADWWLGPEGYAVSPDEQALLSFREGTRLPERYIRFRDPERRRPEAVVQFGDYRPVKGYLLPYALRLEVLHPKTTLTLTYDAVELNTPVTAATFALTIPEGTRVYELR